VAVVGGGYRAVIERTIRFVSMAGCFDATVCANDVTRHKPEPDVFLEAARRAGMHRVDVRLWLPPRRGER
jgi:beta-phosphoglucomutase-like phosphatase (HAD superfamily)